MKDTVSLYIIDENDSSIIGRRLVKYVPRVGDELRYGGEGNEEIYEVTRVLWAYDEPDCPYSRANIGVKIIEIKER